MYGLICVLIAVLVTHATRCVPIMLVKGKIKNRFVRSLFDYIPFAVISSLAFPHVFEIEGMSLAACICGFLVAGVLSYRGKNLLFVVLGATLASLVVMLVFPH